MPVVVKIKVKVRANARSSSLEKLDDGSFVASLKSPPVDGRANAELIGLVAKEFRVAKAAVAIKAGAGARVKLLSVTAD